VKLNEVGSDAAPVVSLGERAGMNLSLRLTYQNWIQPDALVDDGNAQQIIQQVSHPIHGFDADTGVALNLLVVYLTLKSSQNPKRC
jgi:hypothetical protein